MALAPLLDFQVPEQLDSSSTRCYFAEVSAPLVNFLEPALPAMREAMAKDVRHREATRRHPWGIACPRVRQGVC